MEELLVRYLALLFQVIKGIAMLVAGAVVILGIPLLVGAVITYILSAACGCIDFSWRIAWLIALSILALMAFEIDFLINSFRRYELWQSITRK